MYICRRYNIVIINFMRNRFFGMLATIMMGGAVITGLTACSNVDNNGGSSQQKRVALLLPDNSRIDRWGTDLKNLEEAMATYGIKTISCVAPETAEGVVAALEGAGITNMPIITGQDNSPSSQALIKSGKQTMTIDKNLKDMANNTAMIVNGLITNKPITGSQTVAGIPTIYSKITVITKDNL